MRRSLLFVLCSVFVATGLMAQNRTVSGTVTDDKGKGLENVTITVKGTNIGTLTNLDGAFTLNVPANATTLVASRIGFASSEISISGRATVTVQLSTANASMSEVVVVAYGQQQKRAVTGAITTVKAEDIQRQQVTSAVAAIQGLAPGVLVINNTGQPGENPTIRIRGIGSKQASADPLVVVDGIPFNGNLNTINPNDIETINVLKDATATALYGSRAANGVLLITTKKGKKGQAAQINAYGSYGWVSRAVEEYPYVTSDQYMRLAWEALYNDAKGAGVTNPGTYATNNLITGTNGLWYNPYNVANPIDTNGNLKSGAELLWNSDWFKELGGDKSVRKNVGVGVSGGSDKVRYFLSSDYLQQNGYVENSEFKRITARLNTEADLRSWLTTGVNISVSSSNQNFPTQSGTSSRNAVSFARGIASIYPVYLRDSSGKLILDAQGNPQYDFGTVRSNRTTDINQNRPVSKNFNALAINNLDKLLNDRLQTSLNTYGEISFTNYLKFRSNFGLDRYVLSTLTYNNPVYGDAAPVKGRVTRRRDLIDSYTWTNTLNFQKAFGSHNVGAMVSSEAYNFKQESVSATRINFPAPGIYEITAGATAEASTSSTNRHRIESYLGRVTYNYNEKYFIEGTLRRDGSTRFAPDQRWGTFYSVGASWLISGENFMSNITPVNYLKLRASYGEVGNEGVLNGTLQNYFPYIADFSTGWHDMSNAGVVITSLTNPEITWEKLGTYNVGLDFAVLKNRLSGSIEYYNKNTFDLIFDRPVAPSLGFTSVNENIGKMTNRGFEVNLNSTNITNKNFRWETNFNLGTVKNKVTRLPQGQKSILESPFQIVEGKSLREFYIIEWAGVDKNNGDPLWYRDEIINGQPTGKKITTNNNSNATRYYFGTAIPKVTGGFSNNFTYKIFDLSFLFNYAFGHKVLDADYIGLMHGMAFIGSQLHTDILSRWQAPGQVTDVPRMSNKNFIYNTPSTRHLFSGDYVRLRNITLGVTLPKSIVQKQDVVKNFRVYLQADNYLTWARDAKKGFDPEQSITTGTTNFSSSALKTLSVGLTVGF
jgi:TonB-linked SusC/RagA family outer membrane protein